MELSFGEQIKILLKRKNMSIQELALLYEQQTGKKMSRQNLTQRLKRDNFPEQDMHVLAALLGYTVSIQLNPVALPLPEFMQITPVGVQPAVSSPVVPGLNAVSPAAEISAAPGKTTDVSAANSVSDQTPSSRPPVRTEEPEPQMTFQIPDVFRKPKPQGDINPMTGEEYLTNTVRRHPELEEFLQVYDRTTHEWSDVREDYFWEFQESKKKMLGRDYQEPILI